MTLDVIALLLLGVLSYLGWRTGALGQALRIVAALVVLFFGRFAAVFVREALFGSTGFARPVVEVVSYFVAATLLYLAVVLVGWLVIRTMRAATPTLATMDRAGGAALGAVKGAIIVYVLLAGFVLLAVPLKKQDPDDRMHLRDGYLAAFTEQYDIFSPWRVAELDSLQRLLRAGSEAKEEGLEHLLRKHEEAADLLRRQGIQELLADEDLQRAIEEGRLATAFADERIRDLLNDKEFMEELRAVDFDAIEAEIGIESRPAAPTDEKSAAKP